MWRSFFLALGTFLLLLGAQCLGVKQFVLKARAPAPASQPGMLAPPRPGPHKVIDPAPWAPWSLMSTGAVVCLYSFTIPRRLKKG
ncbi:MAG TPA: hypothetical protein EYP56_08335 [Planctomycetaceae bacterium]|nr:hypothetical protein [Planctomycetaceae bacterium]HIQ20378.1 hypothetical protein [Planctomycetota bacterium]